MADNKKLILKEEYCKECGLCIKFCPDKALKYSADFNSKGFHPVNWNGSCSFCGMCYIVCPDFVIEIEEDA